MKELSIQQFMKELLKLSDLNQSQMAKEIGISQGSLSNSIKKGNPRFDILAEMAAVLEVEHEEDVVVLLKTKEKSFAFAHKEYKEIIDVLQKDIPISETAKKMGVNAATLRSRLSRNSCTILHLKAHLAALGHETIFKILDNQYKL